MPLRKGWLIVIVAHDKRFESKPRPHRKKKMKKENHKVASIARSVGISPSALNEVFRRIRIAVMEEGGTVITHELGTFYRSEQRETRKVLNGTEIIVPARTRLFLTGIKGPPVNQS